MCVNNIMIYSDENLGSIGLFAELKEDSGYVDNRVANLTLTTRQTSATKTQAVGLLAGVVEDYHLYNITIDSQDTVIVGGNAVGGVAGIIRGNFAMDKIDSNAQINSTNTFSNQAKIYLGKNNTTPNLQDVYYAGSVAGILDGYGGGAVGGFDNKTTFFRVHNISVSGDVIVIGDIVGSVFGLVGEYVSVDMVSVSLSENAKLSGQVYSGGIIGENRGKLTNATIEFDS